MRTPQPFSFDYYRHLLERGQDAGYVISSFERYDSRNPRTLIMRHDVDYTLNGVAQLARIEIDLGATSTYLFRVHAHEYNVFTPHVYRLIRDLRAAGHEIGLHFEAMSVGRAIGVDPVELLKKEKQFLELVYGAPIITASEHRDISQVVHETPNFHEHHDPRQAGFQNYSLEPRFFRDMKYLSDSNAVWREGDPLQHFGKYDRFQVLIHPDWWFDSHLLLKGPYFHGLGN